MHSSPESIIGTALVFIFFLVLYLIPTFVATSRSHHNSGAIFALNLLFGWTFLGWAIALIWSFTAITVATPPPPK